MKKFPNLHLFFVGFSITIYCLRLFYLRHNCRLSNWWRHKDGHA